MHLVRIPFRAMLPIHLFNAVLKLEGGALSEGFNFIFLVWTSYWAHSPRLRKNSLSSLCFSFFSLHALSEYGFWLLVIGFGKPKWIIISFQITTFLFNWFINSYIAFKLGCFLPFVNRSWIVIVLARKPWANFSKFFFFQIWKVAKSWFFD
jgi:hypothetical protein